VSDTEKLIRNPDGSFTGSHRGHEFRVEKFLDPHRPRTATRWRGPVQRWQGECPSLNVTVWPNTVRRTVVERTRRIDRSSGIGPFGRRQRPQTRRCGRRRGEHGLSSRRVSSDQAA
jgi:hypothetical protein